MTALFDRALSILPLPQATRATPGLSVPAHAPGTIASMETAVALALTGEAAAIVTNPIAKHVFDDAGFRHPGPTEFPARLPARDGAGAVHPVIAGKGIARPDSLIAALRLAARIGARSTAP
jgi:4-hydroxythreonine-4-phosphate dehydrogenase